MTPRKKRILLVDDDPSILESVGLALRTAGYEVITARDGAEGLARAELDAPDLIVLDVVMPRRSGLMVLDRLRRSTFRRPRIVICTANEEVRHREFARSRGADAFVAKPFEIRDLVDEVETLLADAESS